MDRIIRSLDSTNSIKKAMPQIIDAFVMFYGEEYRDFITEKLNNIIVVGYYDSSALFSLLYEEENTLFDEIVGEVFKKLGIENTKENVERYYGSNNSYKYGNLINTYNAVEFITTFKKDPSEILKEEQHLRYEKLKEHIPDLTFEDYFNRNLTEEQIKQLPKYMQRNLDYYFNVDVDSELDRVRRKTLDSVIKVHPGATEANVDELLKTGQLDYILDIGKVIKEGEEKYNAFYEGHLKSYAELYEKLKEYERELNEKYYIKALVEFRDYLSEDNKKALDEMIASGEFSSYNLKGIDSIFSNSLFGQIAISYFDEKSDNKLSNPGVGEFHKDTIKRNRINYFKYRGIDLGDNYDDYVSNPECIKIWPKYEEVAKIEERFDYYANEYNIELYTNNTFYKDALDQTKAKGLLDKDSIFNPATIAQRMTCVYPNIVYEDGNYRLLPIVAINTGSEKQADVRIIHELNHVIELALLEVKGNDYHCICGWDYVDGHINQDSPTFDSTTKKDRTHRGYELFSEIINELLAQRVSKLMHDNGVYILTDEEHCQDYGGTSYERTLFLIRDFFDTYLEDIIASRKDNNIEIIWNKVGKKNFDKMNELFHEFNEKFPEFTFYSLVKDIKNNKDTELVREFNSIKARRDKILLAMKEHSLSRQVAL